MYEKVGGWGEVSYLPNDDAQAFLERRVLLPNHLLLPFLHDSLAAGGRVKPPHNQKGRDGDQGVDVEGCLIPTEFVVHEARADDTPGEAKTCGGRGGWVGGLVV